MFKLRFWSEMFSMNLYELFFSLLPNKKYHNLKTMINNFMQQVSHIN